MTNTRVQTSFNKAAATFAHTAPIYDELATRLVDRLLDTKRSFPRVLDAGCGVGTVGNALQAAGLTPELLVQVDFAENMLNQAQGLRIVADVEQSLPVTPESFDLVTGNMLLHWIEDVPRALIRLGRLLKPDGLFLATTLGINSFPELRAAFAEAGDDTPHIMPLTDVQSAGAALQKVGFAMPVIDRDRMILTYKTLADLWQDLRLSGARNLHPNRRKGLTSPRLLKKVEDIYRQKYARADGRLPVTLEILYLHGWRPAAGQQKPLAPGSATVNLNDVLKTLK